MNTMGCGVKQREVLILLQRADLLLRLIAEVLNDQKDKREEVGEVVRDDGDSGVDEKVLLYSYRRGEEACQSPLFLSFLRGPPRVTGINTIHSSHYCGSRRVSQTSSSRENTTSLKCS